jgi:hypothetical protein
MAIKENLPLELYQSKMLQQEAKLI